MSTLYVAPKHYDWNVSGQLDDLYKAHPRRVRALYERKSFRYIIDNKKTFNSYTQWRRRKTKVRAIP